MFLSLRNHTTIGLITNLKTTSVYRPTFMVKTQPWLRVNGSLNRRVLDKWMGLVLLHCLQNPGITILDVALRFNLMQALQVRHLLEVCFTLFFSFHFLQRNVPQFV